VTGTVTAVSLLWGARRRQQQHTDKRMRATSNSAPTPAPILAARVKPGDSWCEFEDPVGVGVREVVNRGEDVGVDVKWDDE
jgi:hypothetical protein